LLDYYSFTTGTNDQKKPIFAMGTKLRLLSACAGLTAEETETIMLDLLDLTQRRSR